MNISFKNFMFSIGAALSFTNAFAVDDVFSSKENPIWVGNTFNIKVFNYGEARPLTIHTYVYFEDWFGKRDLEYLGQKIQLASVIKGTDYNAKQISYSRSTLSSEDPNVGLYIKDLEQDSLYEFQTDRSHKIYLFHNGMETEVGRYRYVAYPDPMFHLPATTNDFEHPFICQNEYKDVCTLTVSATIDESTRLEIPVVKGATIVDSRSLPNTRFTYNLKLLDENKQPYETVSWKVSL